MLFKIFIEFKYSKEILLEFPENIWNQTYSTKVKHPFPIEITFIEKPYKGITKSL
jgi:hypothetical protein